MRKLIAMIPTEGKSEQEIIDHTLTILRDKGMLKEEHTYDEYDRNEDMMLEALKAANVPKN